MSSRSRLSRSIKSLREFLGLNREGFAVALGVAKTSVFYWETGAVEVGPFNRIRLLEFARRHGAPAEVIAALEEAQPEVGA